MKELVMAHDEAARLRIESLERFIAEKMLGNQSLYYCGRHQVHYTDRQQPDFPLYHCPLGKGRYQEECMVSIA